MKIKQLFAARDSDGGLRLYDKMPTRNTKIGIFMPGKKSSIWIMPDRLLPELTWENSPAEVTVDLQFKIKKSNH